MIDELVDPFLAESTSDLKYGPRHAKKQCSKNSLNQTKTNLSKQNQINNPKTPYKYEPLSKLSETQRKQS